MSSEASYNPSDPTVPNVVTNWGEVDVPTGNPNTLNNPNTSAVNGIVVPYTCKVSGSSIIPFTDQDQTNWNAAVAAGILAQQRTLAENEVTTSADIGKLERAVADIIINQLNLHTAWENAFASAVAGAATLGALKTSVAAITPVPTVTLAQAKTAIISDIASGGVD